MPLPRRLVLPALLTTILAAGACGGPDTATQHVAFADPVSTAVKGGGTSKPGATSPASIAATPTLVDRNAPMTISLYPGSYMNQNLYIMWRCVQNGTLMAHDGSYELHNAVTTGVPGYTLAGDHFDWTFVISQAQNPQLYEGGATCDIQGWYQNRRAQWFQIASGAFDVQP